MKTPPASIVEYALSNRVLMVEGPAEYMLLEKFYVSCVGNTPEMDGVNIIDVRGLSFKRYLEIAQKIGSRVAVLTDNDKDYQKHCVDKYTEYASDANIKIFFDQDNDKCTFEVVLYFDNQTLCDGLFGNDALEYMLNNKTEAAYSLLAQNNPITVPDYMKRAIDWIRK